MGALKSRPCGKQGSGDSDDIVNSVLNTAAASLTQLLTPTASKVVLANSVSRSESGIELSGVAWASNIQQ